MKRFRVGRYENLFIFFWKAIKIAGSAQKTGAVRLVETRVFYYRPQRYSDVGWDEFTKMFFNVMSSYSNTSFRLLTHMS